MSDRAMDWANALPYSIVGPLAFRVLLKLADVATRDGRRAWRSKTELADELEVSTRSVQRAFRELEEAGLVELGDQRHVDHLRADKRCTVYDLTMPQLPARQPMAQLDGISADGETQRGDKPVDNPGAGRQLVSPEGQTLKTDRRPAAVSNRARTLQPAEACPADSAAGILRPHRWSRLGFCANGCGADRAHAA